MLRMLSSPRAADLQLLAARKTPLKEKQRVLPEGLQEGNLWVLAQIVVQGTGATAVDARDHKVQRKLLPEDKLASFEHRVG